MKFLAEHKWLFYILLGVVMMILTFLEFLFVYLVKHAGPSHQIAS